MIKDHTLDEAIIEIARTLKALKKLRAARKLPMANLQATGRYSSIVEHAAAKRASLDLTRKLADLRQGR